MSIHSSVYGHLLADHLPMTLVALAAMGADEAERTRFATRYAERLVPLGDEERALRASIAEEIAMDGRAAVIGRRLVASADGIGALAFHPLIRLGYAVDRDDDDEVAAALASLALYPLPLVSTNHASVITSSSASATTSTSARDAFVELARAIPPVRRTRGLITDAMTSIAQNDEFSEAIARFRPTAAKLPELARTAAGIFAVSRDFTALHMMTALHALRLVLPQIAENEHSSILQSVWTALGASFLTIGPVDVPDDEAIDELAASVTTDWDALFATARAQDDEHVIKAIYTASREEAAYGHRIFRVAAASYAFR